MNALHPRVRLRWGLVGLLVSLVLGGIVTAVDRFLLTVSPLLGAGVAAVALAVVVVYALLLYRSWGYELEPDALALERGVESSTSTRGVARSTACWDSDRSSSTPPDHGART